MYAAADSTPPNEQLNRPEGLKFVPITVTIVPPAVDPRRGMIEYIVACSTNSYEISSLNVKLLFDTLRGTTPGA